MIYIGTDGVGTHMYIDDDGCIVWRSEHLSMRLTNEGLYLIDKYGNEMDITEINAVLKFNSPTYDELYEHWLSTK